MIAANTASPPRSSEERRGSPERVRRRHDLVVLHGGRDVRRHRREVEQRREPERVLSVNIIASSARSARSNASCASSAFHRPAIMQKTMPRSRFAMRSLVSGSRCAAVEPVDRRGHERDDARGQLGQERVRMIGRRDRGAARHVVPRDRRGDHEREETAPRAAGGRASCAPGRAGATRRRGPRRARAWGESFSDQT